MNDTDFAKKSYAFAVRVINLAKWLQNNREFILCKQVIRSGTAVGALIREAEFAESNADYIHKLHIALKEANETAYWLFLLKDTGFIKENMYESMDKDCQELIRLLVSSLKTLKQKKETRR